MQFTTFALASLVAAPVSVLGGGCYSSWRQGSDYVSGDIVSAVVPLNATAGTTQTKNFKCTSGTMPSLSHCPNYDPAGIGSAAAWSDEGVCSGALNTPAPTNKPTAARWTGTGCPDEWKEGTNYEGGDLSELDGLVYKCSEAQAVSTWCGQSGYKPGDSLYWTSAWTLLGSCDGTISPTKSPVYVSLADAGGCPDEYDPSATYDEGDKVMANDIVYKCRPWPNSGWCSMDAYAPGGDFSKDAWTTLGYCDGTISPTKSPSFSSLTDQNGCPLDFSSSTTYEAGDKVSVEANGVEKLVYECKSFPDSGYCNQYEPGHWSKLGWRLLGYCEGTISPTASPIFSALTDHNGCPNEYDASADYEANDKVSIEVTGTHSVVWQCSSDVHQSRYCSQYEPGNDYNLGWKLIGYCDGTISPTASPIFSALDETGAGCPKAYNVATTYEEGDVVSVEVSGTPDRTIVYQCKSWPNGAYCNAGPNFAPDSDNGSMGWTLKGYCDGTISPTAAPIAYTPVAKCRWYNGTKAVTISPWSTTALNTYGFGTRVRKDERIYKCKGWPNGLWCKMAVYEPEEGTYWNDAWTRAGDCTDALAPTTSPSASPTSSPSKSPTKRPTKSPSKAPTKRPSKSPSKAPSKSPTK